MKKISIVLVMVFSLSSLSYSNASAKLSAIQKELELLEQKEINKFKAEEKNAEQSKMRYDNYLMMMSESNKKIELMNSSLSTSLFPKETKKLIEKYESFAKLIKREASVEKKKIDEFNQLKNILGY